MQNNIQNKTLIAVGKNGEEYEFKVQNSYQYSTKGCKLTIELIEEADGFMLFSCEGVRYPVEIVSRKLNNYEVLVNGVSYNFTVETPFSLKRREILAANQPVSDGEDVCAPMPGKIVSIIAQEGMEVNPGDPLLVLEAMKMQNTLTASVKGVVKTVAAKAGATVGKDELLVEIKKA